MNDDTPRRASGPVYSTAEVRCARTVKFTSLPVSTQISNSSSGQIDLRYTLKSKEVHMGGFGEIQGSKVSIRLSCTGGVAVICLACVVKWILLPPSSETMNQRSFFNNIPVGFVSNVCGAGPILNNHLFRIVKPNKCRSSPASEIAAEVSPPLDPLYLNCLSCPLLRNFSPTLRQK